MPLRLASLLLLGAAVLSASPAAAQPRFPEGFGQGGFPPPFAPPFEPPPGAESQGGGADAGTKVCSVLRLSQWRDTFWVPETWTLQDCRAFAASVGALHAQLGCIFASGDPKFVWGGLDGQPPPRDCGWAEGAREAATPDQGFRPRR